MRDNWSIEPLRIIYIKGRERAWKISA